MEALSEHSQETPRKFQWIKGHNAHPQNERCDHLAEKAAKQSPVNVDAFFEQNQNKSDPS